jgi:hypothetical protein
MQRNTGTAVNVGAPRPRRSEARWFVAERSNHTIPQSAAVLECIERCGHRLMTTLGSIAADAVE